MPTIDRFHRLARHRQINPADETVAILGCPLCARDQLEAALRRSRIGADTNFGWAANELLTTLAK